MEKMRKSKLLKRAEDVGYHYTVQGQFRVKKWKGAWMLSSLSYNFAMYEDAHAARKALKRGGFKNVRVYKVTVYGAPSNDYQRM